MCFVGLSWRTLLKALGFYLRTHIELYKFCSFGANSLSILINQKVWYCKPADFNDPFDGDFFVSDKCSFDDFLAITSERLTSDSQENIKLKYCDSEGMLLPEVIERYSDIIGVFKNVGVLCLTPRRDSVLMWSHYADEHQGFAIKFNIPDTMPCNDIDYSDTLPQYPLPFYYNNLVNNGYIDIQFTKHTDWEYENEVRISVNKGNRLCDLPGKITEIIFGCRMPETHKQTILNLIDLLPYGDDIKLLDAFKESNLSLGFKPHARKT